MGSFLLTIRTIMFNQFSFKIATIVLLRALTIFTCCMTLWVAWKFAVGEITHPINLQSFWVPSSGVFEKAPTFGDSISSSVVFLIYYVTGLNIYLFTGLGISRFFWSIEIRIKRRFPEGFIPSGSGALNS